MLATSTWKAAVGKDEMPSLIREDASAPVQP
jgi:hypothetical protein